MFDRAHSRRQACQNPREPQFPAVLARSSVNRAAPIARPGALVGAAIVVIALGVGALGCGGSGGKSPTPSDGGADKPHTCSTASGAGAGAGMTGDTCGCDGDCQQRLLRRRRLLQHRLHRDAARPATSRASPGICAFVPAGGTPRDAEPLPEVGRRRPAASTARATAAAAAASTPPARSASPAPATATRSSASTSATAQGRCKAGSGDASAPRSTATRRPNACVADLPIEQPTARAASRA